MMEYHVPSAEDVPAFELDSTVTLTNTNPLGVNGIGEAGTIGSTPAAANAVMDALSPLGIKHIDMPLTSEQIWRAMRAAGEGRRWSHVCSPSRHRRRTMRLSEGSAGTA